MGRRVPNENNITLLDSFFHFSLCMVGLATSIAIISALCSVRLRRKSSAPAPISDHDDSHEVTNSLNPEATTTISIEHEQHPSTTSDTTMLDNTTHTHTHTQTQTQTETETQNNDVLIKELPLPPALQQHPDVDPKIVKRANSESKMSFNLSMMKMRRSLSMARNMDRNNVGGKKGKMKTEESVWTKTKGKLQKDESVWMKTIILGGKCVPDEEEDAIIYEGKGKKISAYHPRKSTSVSLSGQWSYINPDAIPVPQPHEERIKA